MQIPDARPHTWICSSPRLSEHARVEHGLSQGVLPSLLPRELLSGQFLQRTIVDEVIQPPTRRHMTDDDDVASRPSRGEVTKKPAHARNGLSPALASGIRHGQVLEEWLDHLASWRPVQFAVVTFSKPPVVQDWNGRGLEGQGGSLNRAGEIRGEHCVDSVHPSPLAEKAGLLASRARQLAG